MTADASRRSRRRPTSTAACASPFPADLKLPPRTLFSVAAWHGAESHDETDEATLAVESAGYDAQLALDRPLYQPGDAVRYRSLVLSRFGLTADRDVPVHFEILDPAGAVLAGSPLDAVSKQGVAERRVCDPRPIARRAIHAGRSRRRRLLSPAKAEVFRAAVSSAQAKEGIGVHTR